MICDNEYDAKHLRFDMCRTTLTMPINESFSLMRQTVASHLSRRSPCIFKFGITWRVKHRFYNDEYGYLHEGYKEMHVLALLPVSQSQKLEERLVSIFKDQAGCRNDAPGGEGFKKDGSDERPCFNYFVLVESDDYSHWRRKMLRVFWEIQ